MTRGWYLKDKWPLLHRPLTRRQAMAMVGCVTQKMMSQIMSNLKHKASQSCLTRMQKCKIKAGVSNKEWFYAFSKNSDWHLSVPLTLFLESCC